MDEDDVAAATRRTAAVNNNNDLLLVVADVCRADSISTVSIDTYWRLEFLTRLSSRDALREALA